MTGTPGKLDDFISTDKINLSQVALSLFIYHVIISTANVSEQSVV